MTKAAPIAADPLAVHAVCLTGLERSFGEIGANVRASTGCSGRRSSACGRHRTTGRRSAAAAVCGRADAGAVLERRAAHWTLSWLHCLSNTAGRRRLPPLVLQSLCDLQCEEAIASHEASRGAPYATVLRLRADLFWEAEFAPRPDWTAPATVTVPFQDSSGGVNDKLAIGERAAMARYLTRLRHVDPGAPPPPRGKTTEHFLSTALRADGVAVVRSERWTYCAYTYNSIVKASPGASRDAACRARASSSAPSPPSPATTSPASPRPGRRHRPSCSPPALRDARRKTAEAATVSTRRRDATLARLPCRAPPTKPLVPLDANIMEGALEERRLAPPLRRRARGLPAFRARGRRRACIGTPTRAPTAPIAPGRAAGAARWRLPADDAKGLRGRWELAAGLELACTHNRLSVSLRACSPARATSADERRRAERVRLLVVDDGEGVLGVDLDDAVDGHAVGFFPW